jgi:transcriptional regulator with XRE-family HTH domain
MKLDLVLRLREARRLSGLCQREAAQRSGVGEKSISSFETGERIASLKVKTLRSLLTAYGLTEEAFYSDEFEEKLLSDGVGFPIDDLTSVATKLRHLPDEARNQLIAAFDVMASHASDGRPLTLPKKG